MGTRRMMHPPRFEDWPRRLEDYIDAARAEPFRWGRSDCLHFALGVVEVLTGRDVVAQLGGPQAYDSEDQARALCGDRFGGDPARLVDSVLSRRDLCAGRGNIAAFPFPEADGGFTLAFGVIDGSGRRIAARTASGLSFLRLDHACIVWEV